MQHYEYLAHHGIQNQRWGKRNGPPYPLSRTAHARVVRGSKKPPKNAPKKSTITKEQVKKGAKIAGAVASGTGAAVTAFLAATALTPYVAVPAAVASGGALTSAFLAKTGSLLVAGPAVVGNMNKVRHIVKGD